MAGCEKIGYVPKGDLAARLADTDVREPITPEGIPKYLIEWFAEDDIGNVTSKNIPDRHTVVAAAQKLSAEAKDKIKKEIK
ncbi:hypothetical protein FS749_013154, partial [Ceratobasidium sp. UAMH 11750]